MGLFTEDIEQVVQSFPLFRHFFSTYMFNLVLYSKTSLFKSFFYTCTLYTSGDISKKTQGVKS